MESTPGSDSADPAQPGADAPDNLPSSLVWPKRIASVWLLCWTGLAVWSAYELATAWPHDMHPLVVVLVIAVPGVLFRMTELAFMLRRGRRLTGWWRTGWRFAAILSGLTLGFVLEITTLEQIRMARFEHAISPWVAQVHARPPKTCPTDDDYPAGAALNAYIKQSSGLRRVTLHHGGNGHFVIELGARTIDIDGATVYYDSVARKWKSFHNDGRKHGYYHSEEAMAFESLTEPMAECRFELS